MKTSELIDMLSADAGPVRRWRIARTIAVMIAAGGLVAFIAILAVLGIRTDLTGDGHTPSLSAKLIFTLGVVALGAIYLNTVARPGGERRAPVWLVLLPFIAAACLAVLSLLFVPSRHWHAMIAGNDWRECLLAIPAIAVVPFALLVWAMRQAAPTDLRRAGISIGLAAGGVSAAVYALHCPDDSLLFVAVWYGGTISLCTLAGAILGPRLLRW